MFTILEPNLRNSTGHYAEFVRALGRVVQQQEEYIAVIAHPEAKQLLKDFCGVVASDNTGTGIGEFGIIRDHLKNGKKLLILTAKTKHILLTQLACLLEFKNSSKICFYFHWKEKHTIGKLLIKICFSVKKHSLAITPLETIKSSYEKHGWSNAIAIPYPALREGALDSPQAFKYLLMAGAARRNKGLDIVTKLVEKYKTENRSLRLVIQLSPKHVDRHGSGEFSDIKKLQEIEYPYLNTFDHAPERKEYINLYQGALVLAPYDKERFSDAVSGIVLDALLHATPVIATEGTWAGDLVKKYGAGYTILERSVDELDSKIKLALRNWEEITKNAIRASEDLVIRHDPRILLNSIKDY